MPSDFLSDLPLGAPAVKPAAAAPAATKPATRRRRRSIASPPEETVEETIETPAAPTSPPPAILPPPPAVTAETPTPTTSSDEAPAITTTPEALDVYFDDFLESLPHPALLAWYDLGISRISVLCTKTQEELLKPRGSLAPAHLQAVEAWLHAHGVGLRVPGESHGRASPPMPVAGVTVPTTTADTRAARQQYLKRLRRCS